MLKHIVLLIIAGFGLSNFSNAQNSMRKQGFYIKPTVCFASGNTEKSYIPPPIEFLQKSGTESKSEFIVTYSLFPENAKTAFEYALSIWEQIIESDIPIRIKANWRSLETNVLASAGPYDYYSDFEYAPQKNRYYPISVVEKITGKEISGSGVPDIEATINKDIKWYYGTDGNTPAELYDLVTVALHEIGHGLGFTGFFYTTGKLGYYGNDKIGDASAFDIMVVDGINNNLIDTSFYRLATTSLFNAFVSDALFSSSLSAKNASPGKRVRLYAPSVWNDGSSIYHLNDASYPSTDENSLMTHAIGKGEAVHDPGPITRGILADIGWKIMKLDIQKPKDTETIQPIDFRVSITSDYALNNSKLFLMYSTDSFKNHIDSVLLVQDVKPGNFKATLLPESSTLRIDYFISARDIMNRVFYLPSDAPINLYSVSIGPDNQSPLIDHSPPPYFLLNGDELVLSAIVTDNLGIDSVYASCSVNGMPISVFGLINSSGDNYKGVFTIPQNQLKDGDVISYRIFASDASSAKNSIVSPTEDEYSFRIEKIFEPIGGYINDFNNPTSDFVISDFEIYTAGNFSNPALHSPHPYPSPDKNNSSLNFFTILKYPVVLKPGGTMSYDEVVLVEPGEVLSKFGDEDFWDYVIAEGSKDNGKTWLPLVNGYDSGSNNIWKSNYNKEIVSQVSKSEGRSEWFINKEIKLLENGNFKANDTVLIRFRLYSDPYAHGWGWTIDNLRIQTPVSIQEKAKTIISSIIYPNPFNDIIHLFFRLPDVNNDISIEIYNQQGQKLYAFSEKKTENEFTSELNLQNLPAGMYIAKLNINGTNNLIHKIIKQ